MSHCSMVHTPIPRPDSQILEAKAALDEEWKNLQKLLAWDESNVSSEAEVIRRAKPEGKKVHFCNINGLMSSQEPCFICRKGPKVQTKIGAER